MTDSSETGLMAFDKIRQHMLGIQTALNETLLGQEQLVLELLSGIFAPGHVLLEGPPGLGKTQLAKAVAKLMGVPLSRIQCTPDLMPADITGSEMLASDSTQDGHLQFRPGPIFSSVVLVDEINRAAPRTQSAFLEAMAERQVTCMGQRYELPDPFWMLATQNPIELEGTYPLPEAQLDRFLLKITVPYPDAKTLMAISASTLGAEPADQLLPIITPGEMTACLDMVQQIIVAPAVRQAAVDLIIATQPGSGHELARLHVRYGASPRGLQSLLRAARVAAMLDGRAHVAVDDIKLMALPTLRHRLLLNFESEVEGMTPDALLDDILGAVLV